LQLPDLPFGNDRAFEARVPDDAAEALSRIVPSIRLIAAVGEEPFRSRSALARLSGVDLVANVATPGVLCTEDSRGWHLIAPLHGRARIQLGPREHALQAGDAAILLPPGGRVTRTGMRSVVIARLSPGDIQRGLALATGRDPSPADLQERPYVLPLRLIPGSFSAFSDICRLIDTQLRMNRTETDDPLGLSDILIRWVVLALRKEAEAPACKGGGKLDRVCEMISAAPERAMTLSQMCEQAGLSSRMLQYAFQARFGCSPMAWQRRQRLSMARRRLLFEEPAPKLAWLAHDVGFGSQAACAFAYRKVFGETPSQTLARRR